MNKLGLQVGYFRGTEYEHDVFSALPLVKAAGADIYELAIGELLELEEEKQRDIARAAKDSGILLSTIMALDTTSDISSDDETARKNGIRRCKKALRCASNLGASIFCGMNYTAWPNRPKNLLTRDEKNRIRDICVESMKQIIPLAEDLGIDYCCEVSNRFESFLLNTAAEGVDFAERVGSPRAKILLDTFHMNIEEDSIIDAIAYAQRTGRLGHMHLGESNRRIPGTGKTHMPWAEIFKTVRETGYAGSMVLEPVVRMGIPFAMKTCLWRELTDNETMQEYMDDVTKGLTYIREGLR